MCSSDLLDLLQELLAEYEGTVLLVSHDRDFLDRIVTSTIVLEGDGMAAEYPGGYSDYLRQRPSAGKRAPAARTAKPDRKAKPKASGEQRRLGYKQQRALEQLPGRMETLATEIGELESNLADPDLYARDRAGFDRIATRLDDARAELAAAEEEWLELELLRESLGSG